MKVEAKVNVGRHGCSSIDSAQTVAVQEQEQEQRDERGSSHSRPCSSSKFRGVVGIGGALENEVGGDLGGSEDEAGVGVGVVLIAVT